jgi:hypothetical protein
MTILQAPFCQSSPVSQAEFTTPGTTSWVAPTGVYSVCVVCVGGGGGPAANGSGASGGGGGGLGWKNNIAVTPGQSYTVTVGAGGARAITGTAGAGGQSFFIDPTIVAGNGGGGGTCASDVVGTGGTFVGDGGGNGGNGGSRGGSAADAGGGGGAGGYSGTGGAGGSVVGGVGQNGNLGAGGSGGGGGACGSADTAGSGGGVGLLGEGRNGEPGAGGTSDGAGGQGGSIDGPSLNAPEDASFWSFAGNPLGNVYSTTALSSPGRYGGGGCGADNTNLEQAPGGGGAVRIIWGLGRAYPFQNTVNLP